jgi:hypothetical protein
MREYTPKTEQVRRFWRYGANAWLNSSADDRDRGPNGSFGAEFDRWLAEVKAEAWDEGAMYAAVECNAIDDESEPWIATSENPYREVVK